MGWARVAARDMLWLFGGLISVFLSSRGRREGLESV